MKFPPYMCVECGAEGNAGSYHGGEEIYAARACFNCHFWLKKVVSRDEPGVVRAGGIHYTIGKEGEAFPGFSGQRFVVVFNDGRRVETTNLWHQGTIPERFRERLPDNATFERDPNMAARRMTS